jgi:hypothetical protein
MLWAGSDAGQAGFPVRRAEKAVFFFLQSLSQKLKIKAKGQRDF